MKVETCRPVYILFNVYEINCCVIDLHICIFYTFSRCTQHSLCSVPADRNSQVVYNIVIKSHAELHAYCYQKGLQPFFAGMAPHYTTLHYTHT